MTQQGFNQGMILAIRSDGRPGGHVDIEHIDGIQHSVGRAVPIPGSTLRSQPLRINDDQESLLSYPFRITLNMLGFSVFKFKWDATGIPLATAGQGSKAMFTAMRYRANVPGSSRPDLSNQTGKLYWYSNLADLRSLTDHLDVPNIPINAIQNAIDRAMPLIRAAYAATNSGARLSLGGTIVLS